MVGASIQTDINRLLGLRFSQPSRSHCRGTRRSQALGLRLFVSDKCLGLVEALGEFYADAQWPRCVVHLYRNVFTVVPRGKMKEEVAMLKAIHAREGRQAAWEKAQAVVEKLVSMRLGEAAPVVRDGVDETLSCMSFPREHWLRVRSNNMLERIVRTIRRRTRVADNFPDGKSALMLVVGRLRHIAGTRWGTRQYFDMSRMREQTEEEQLAAAKQTGECFWAHGAIPEEDQPTSSKH
ncbi:MAG: transposase [Planctomycetia bacterium]|nr:transposase [Planctomycetia bacterium]